MLTPDQLEATAARWLPIFGDTGVENVLHAWQGGFVLDFSKTMADAKRVASDTCYFLAELAPPGPEWRPVRGTMPGAITFMNGGVAGELVFCCLEQFRNGYLHGIAPTRIDLGSLFYVLSTQEREVIASITAKRNCRIV